MDSKYEQIAEGVFIIVPRRNRVIQQRNYILDELFLCYLCNRMYQKNKLFSRYARYGTCLACCISRIRFTRLPRRGEIITSGNELKFVVLTNWNRHIAVYMVMWYIMGKKTNSDLINTVIFELPYELFLIIVDAIEQDNTYIRPLTSMLTQHKMIAAIK